MDYKPIPKLTWNIYWINLERRPDRKEYMEKILENNKENNFRIEAVDYKNNFNPYNIIKNTKHSDGLNACTCSHIKAMNIFLTNSNDEYCFISEDDLSNDYSEYWQEKHYNILKNSNYDILQLQTTEDYYKNNKLDPIEAKKKCSGATFYKISRNTASIIVSKYLKNNTINLLLTDISVPDHLIWNYGKVYLLPMFSYLDVKDSDTMEDNKDMNEYWTNYFNNGKNNYLNLWKNI